MSEHLDRWFEGWRAGDAELILSAVTDDFIYDDPVDGRFTKAEFAAYLRELFAGRGGLTMREDASEGTAPGFETIGDVVAAERDGEETAWGWWTAGPGEGEGAGLVKARPDGVYLERVAYYTLPGSA